MRALAGNQEKAAEFKKGDKVWIERPVAEGRKFVHRRYGYQVTVMGTIENYAMVRFPGAMPFVESIRDLRKWNPDAPPAVNETPEAH